MTILTVLYVIGGLLALIFRSLSTFMGPTIAAQAAAADEAAAMATGPMMMGFGVFGLIMGLLYLITAYGLFGLKPWAWTVAVVVQVLALVSHLAGFFQGQVAGAVVGLLIAGGILFYLMRPHVKAAFGRA